MKRLGIFTPLLLLAVVGCQTTYGPRGMAGGYEEMQVDAATYQVSFHGNPNTSLEKVRDYALLRAAELGSNMGYTYFSVVGEENRTERSTTQVITRHDDHHGHHDDHHALIRIGGHDSDHHRGHIDATSSASIEPGIMLLVKYFEEYPAGERLPNPVMECTTTYNSLVVAYEIEE